MASYVNTFVAQYYGAGRYHRIGPVLWQGVYVSIIGGIVLLCIIPFARTLFSIIGHQPIIQRHEVEYFQILCLGAGPVIASSAISGFFAGRGRPWPVMWVNTVSTVVNLIMDYALIFGNWGFPEMGIRGAGIASILSALFSLFIYMTLLFSKANAETYHTLRGWRPEKELFLRLCRFGFPAGVQFFLDMAGFTVFILLVGRLGIANLAATNITLNISTLAFMPMIGSGIAVSVLVGQYLGKNRPDLAQKSTYSGFHISILYMTSVAGAYVFIPEIFIAPFVVQAKPGTFVEIHRLTLILLKFVAVYSLFDCMNIIFSSAIKGAGDTRFAMATVMIVSVTVLVIPTYLAVSVFRYGLIAAWVSASAYIIILGSVFYYRFLGGKWKTMRVIERSVPGRVPEKEDGDRL